MQNRTLGDMIGEIYAVVVGVPGTDDTGLVGDVKEIKREQQELKKEVKRINGCVATNTAWRKIFCFLIPGLAAAIGFLAGATLL